jgi:RNA-binding motif X-linked protein 2
MNSIRSIQALNKREIEAGIPPSASWHTDYRDTAYIYIGGLPFELTEGDIVTIFSQYGEPTWVKLVRDKETGKSKGFGWLKYEDQRSCDLAVDNLGGAEVLGRVVRVDHARYERREEKDGEGDGIDLTGRENGQEGKAEEEESDEEEESRPLLKEEIELRDLINNHDDDDPMKEYLVKEKKEEVEEALRRMRERERDGKGNERRKRRDHGEKKRVGGKESRSRRVSHRHRDDEDQDWERRHHDSRRERGDDERERSPREHRSDRNRERRER